MIKFRNIEIALMYILLALTLSCQSKKTNADAKINATTSNSQNNRFPSFASKRATEATLKFTTTVEIISETKPLMATVKEQIENQVTYLFGPMERAKYSAAPKEDHKISNIKIQKKQISANSETNVFEISYTYQGTIVLESGPQKYYDVILPINPSTIFQQALVNKENPCTDEHYSSEGDFWYFWSPAPAYPNCKLKEGVDYRIVRGEIERIKPESKRTYPEFQRLAHDGIIDVHMFFGMNEVVDSINPQQSRDVNAETYRNVRESLVKMGFETHQWSKAEIKKITQAPGSDADYVLPFVEEAIKDFPNKNIKMRVRLMFGETGIEENSQAFHYLFKDALSNSSVMIFDGHSGLGGNLDLDTIASTRNFKLKPNPNRYQIYFFNSCTSYTYYNTLYFQKKRKRASLVDPKGTKNLDLMANGLSTTFDSMGSSNLALINAIYLWATKSQWTSYQTLVSRIDSDNLFTINGDEDNPTEPVR
jgi:hypothetical protein